MEEFGALWLGNKIDTDIDEDDLRIIAKRFFEKLREITNPSSDFLLFDTTNYYTFMASNTPSVLAKRGKNKEGRNNLRQVGLGLLVERKSRLPLYYAASAGKIVSHAGKTMLKISGTLDKLNLFFDIRGRIINYVRYA